MRTWFTAGGIGVLVLAATFAAKPKPGPWLPDYNAAKALARQSGKPLLVVFR